VAAGHYWWKTRTKSGSSRTKATTGDTGTGKDEKHWKKGNFEENDRQAGPRHSVASREKKNAQSGKVKQRTENYKQGESSEDVRKKSLEIKGHKSE